VITDIVKNLIIPPLASRPVSALASHFLSPHVPVFLVHQLVHDKKYGYGITHAHLRKCLAYLVKKGHTFVSLEEAILAIKNGTTLPDKSVVFTMDDGYLEQATIAAPIFLEFGCPVTFFVVTDMLDQKLWPWDAKISWLINNSLKQQLTVNFDDETLALDISGTEQKHLARHNIRNYLKEIDSENIDVALNQLAIATDVAIPESPPDIYKALSWDIARELEKKGVTFAPHSKTHRILSKVRAATARQEIEHSWQRLNEELSKPLNVFCYPTGRKFDFGPREISILKENNFLGAVSTMPGYLTPLENASFDLFSLPRFNLPDSMADFIQYCTWIEHAKASAGLY